jgi:hypothetical protein
VSWSIHLERALDFEGEAARSSGKREQTCQLICCTYCIKQRESFDTTRDDDGQYNKQTQLIGTTPKPNAGKHNKELLATREHNSTHHLRSAAPTT